MAIRLAVLLSGSGTTLQNVIDQAGRGELDVEVAGVISSRAGVYGLERAKKHGIPSVTVSRKEAGGFEEFNVRLWEEIRKFTPDLVVLAGFMSLLDVPADFTNRIMNVHPALIPAFCGKGMYGHHVHEAVVGYGVKLTGGHGAFCGPGI